MRNQPDSPTDTDNDTRWTGVEFRHLGALAAVAREGSFRRAAERLGYVQSAISSQIAQLERAVGSQLLDRPSAGGATLTPAGRILLEHCDEILARLDAARVDLDALANGSGSSVRLCAVEGVGQRRLAPILTAFVDRFPDGRVTIDQEEPGSDAFQELATGGCDLLITELPAPAGPFEHTLLERDPYVLLVAADSKLGRAPHPPEPEQLARLPLILPRAIRPGDPVATRIREAVVDRPPWMRTATAAEAQALTGAGLGASIVPAIALVPNDPATVAIDISHLIPPRRLALVTHRERAYGTAAAALIELVSTHISVDRTIDDRMGNHPHESYG